MYIITGIHAEIWQCPLWLNFWQTLHNTTGQQEVQFITCLIVGRVAQSV